MHFWCTNRASGSVQGKKTVAGQGTISTFYTRSIRSCFDSILFPIIMYFCNRKVTVLTPTTTFACYG